VHPDYLQELYGQRLSLQSGSKRTALAGSVQVSDVFVVDGKAGLPQDDNETWTKDGQGTGIRGPRAKGGHKLEGIAKPAPGKIFLILRTNLGAIDADAKSSMVSFTPAAVRLVTKGRNYFPIGTVDDGQVLFRNAVDDVLFVEGGKSADLVFEVPETDFAPAAGDPANRKLVSDVFLEFKRFARVDLGGKAVFAGIKTPTDAVAVVRKEGTPSGTVGKVTNATLKIGPWRVAATLESPLNVGTTKEDAKGDTEWGSFALQNGRFLRVEVKPVRSLSIMGRGQETIREFFVPKDRRMLMISAQPAGKDPWKWADDLANYQLVDSKGTRYKPNGAMAKVLNKNTDTMVIRYDADKPQDSAPSDKTMKPTDVTLLFLLPRKTQLKSLDYKKDLMALMPMTVD
jgi:hypothetical protein